MILREAVGSELREVRTDKNLTLRGVAENAMISYSYLSELERGHKEVSSELLASICRALDVTVSDVLFGVTEKIVRAEEQ